jgi:hypothetical protein
MAWEYVARSDRRDSEEEHGQQQAYYTRAHRHHPDHLINGVTHCPEEFGDGTTLLSYRLRPDGLKSLSCWFALGLRFHQTS